MKIRLLLFIVALFLGINLYAQDEFDVSMLPSDAKLKEMILNSNKESTLDEAIKYWYWLKDLKKKADVELEKCVDSKNLDKENQLHEFLGRIGDIDFKLYIIFLNGGYPLPKAKEFFKKVFLEGPADSCKFAKTYYLLNKDLSDAFLTALNVKSESKSATDYLCNSFYRDFLGRDDFKRISRWSPIRDESPAPEVRMTDALYRKLRELELRKKTTSLTVIMDILAYKDLKFDFKEMTIKDYYLGLLDICLEKAAIDNFTASGYMDYFFMSKEDKDIVISDKYYDWCAIITYIKKLPYIEIEDLKVRTPKEKGLYRTGFLALRANLGDESVKSELKAEISKTDDITVRAQLINLFGGIAKDEDIEYLQTLRLGDKMLEKPPQLEFPSDVAFRERIMPVSEAIDRVCNKLKDK